MLKTIVLGGLALMLVVLSGCCWWPGPWHEHGRGHYDRPGYSQGYGPTFYQDRGYYPRR